MGMHLKLVSSDYLETYTLLSSKELEWAEVASILQVKSSYTSEDFEYNLIASSLYSSKIEGNTLDADSFFRNRKKNDSPKQKEVLEIEDLVKAYQFATEHPLDKSNFIKTHAFLARTLLPAQERGRAHQEQVGIRDSRSLRPVYLAVEPEFVNQELSTLFSDIATLINLPLTQREVFYYASTIHLHIALIHPFMDGNGRSARLLEKWFLASKLGPGAWSILSEKYYWDHRSDYYQNIALGATTTPFTGNGAYHFC